MENDQGMIFGITILELWMNLGGLIVAQPGKRLYFGILNKFDKKAIFLVGYFLEEKVTNHYSGFCFVSFCFFHYSIYWPENGRSGIMVAKFCLFLRMVIDVAVCKDVNWETTLQSA